MNKKLKAVIAVMIVTVTVFLAVMPFGAVQIKRYYGDIDCDGDVTVQDARIALMAAVKIYEYELTDMDLIAADINGDGEITSVDARLILRIAAGLQKKEEIENYEFSVNSQELVNKINAMRVEKSADATPLVLSDELCMAAQEAAQEYATATGTALFRENGAYYYTLLDEIGISYTFADKMIVESSFGYIQAFEAFASEQQSKKALCSENFNKIGIGAFSDDGITFYWCIFLIKD